MGPRKVYMSSKFREPGSTSSTDFRFELPVDIEVGEDTHVAVSDVVIPHAFYNITEGSHRLYFCEGNPLSGNDRIAYLIPGFYTASQLANHIGVRMTAATISNITYTGSGPTPTTNKITITQAGSGAAGFFVYSDHLLMTGGRRDQIPIPHPKSINHYLSIPTDTTVVQTFTTGFLNLLFTTELFIRSPDMGLDTLDGNTGRRDVLKKVVCNVPFRELIISPSTFERSDLSKVYGNIRSINIQLTDAHGTVIDLNNNDWSMSLNFVDSP